MAMWTGTFATTERTSFTAVELQWVKWIQTTADSAITVKNVPFAVRMCRENMADKQEQSASVHAYDLYGVFVREYLHLLFESDHRQTQHGFDVLAVADKRDVEKLLRQHLVVPTTEIELLSGKLPWRVRCAIEKAFEQMSSSSNETRSNAEAEFLRIFVAPKPMRKSNDTMPDIDQDVHGKLHQCIVDICLGYLGDNAIRLIMNDITPSNILRIWLNNIFSRIEQFLEEYFEECSAQKADFDQKAECEKHLLRLHLLRNAFPLLV